MNSSVLPPTTLIHPVLQGRSSVELYTSLVSYAFLIIACVVGNGLVISAYIYNHRLRKAVTHTLIIGLASADFLVGLVSLPIWMYFTASDPSDHQLHFAAYQVYITIDIFIGGASILQLMCISVERTHAVMRPIQHRQLRKRTFYCAVAAAWVSSGVLASLQPLQYGTDWQMAYTVLMATACFFIPSVVVIVAYCNIFGEVRGRKKLTSNSSNKNVTLAREVRLSLTVAIITMLFVITWLPLFTLTMVASFNPKVLPSPTTTIRLLHFVKWMHYSSSASNPFLYSYRILDIRRTISVMLSRVFLGRGPKLDEVFRSRSNSVASSRFRKMSTVSEKTRKTSTASQPDSPGWNSGSNYSWFWKPNFRKLSAASEQTRKTSGEPESQPDSPDWTSGAEFCWFRKPNFRKMSAVSERTRKESEESQMDSPGWISEGAFSWLRKPSFRKLSAGFDQNCRTSEESHFGSSTSRSGSVSMQISFFKRGTDNEKTQKERSTLENNKNTHLGNRASMLHHENPDPV